MFCSISVSPHVINLGSVCDLQVTILQIWCTFFEKKLTKKNLRSSISMFKISADMPINLPINHESLGERYDYNLSSRPIYQSDS
jgi:hypothetical protein